MNFFRVSSYKSSSDKPEPEGGSLETEPQPQEQGHFSRFLTGSSRLFRSLVTPSRTDSDKNPEKEEEKKQDAEELSSPVTPDADNQRQSPFKEQLQPEQEEGQKTDPEASLATSLSKLSFQKSSIPELLVGLVDKTTNAISSTASSVPTSSNGGRSSTENKLSTPSSIADGSKMTDPVSSYLVDADSDEKAIDAEMKEEVQTKPETEQTGRKTAQQEPSKNDKKLGGEESLMEIDGDQHDEEPQVHQGDDPILLPYVEKPKIHSEGKIPIILPYYPIARPVSSQEVQKKNQQPQHVFKQNQYQESIKLPYKKAELKKHFDMTQMTMQESPKVQADIQGCAEVKSVQFGAESTARPDIQSKIGDDVRKVGDDSSSRAIQADKQAVEPGAHSSDGEHKKDSQCKGEIIFIIDENGMAKEIELEQDPKRARTMEELDPEIAQSGSKKVEEPNIFDGVDKKTVTNIRPESTLPIPMTQSVSDTPPSMSTSSAEAGQSANLNQSSTTARSTSSSTSILDASSTQMYNASSATKVPSLLHLRHLDKENNIGISVRRSSQIPAPPKRAPTLKHLAGIVNDDKTDTASASSKSTDMTNESNQTQTRFTAGPSFAKETAPSGSRMSRRGLSNTNPESSAGVIAIPRATRSRGHQYVQGRGNHSIRGRGRGRYIRGNYHHSSNTRGAPNTSNLGSGTYSSNHSSINREREREEDALILIRLAWAEAMNAFHALKSRPDERHTCRPSGSARLRLALHRAAERMNACSESFGDGDARRVVMWVDAEEAHGILMTLDVFRSKLTDVLDEIYGASLPGGHFHPRLLDQDQVGQERCVYPGVAPRGPPRHGERPMIPTQPPPKRPLRIAEPTPTKVAKTTVAKGPPGHFERSSFTSKSLGSNYELPLSVAGDVSVGIDAPISGPAGASFMTSTLGMQTESTMKRPLQTERITTSEDAVGNTLVSTIREASVNPTHHLPSRTIPRLSVSERPRRVVFCPSVVVINSTEGESSTEPTKGRIEVEVMDENSGKENPVAVQKQKGDDEEEEGEEEDGIGTDQEQEELLRPAGDAGLKFMSNMVQNEQKKVEGLANDKKEKNEDKKEDKNKEKKPPRPRVEARPLEPDNKGYEMLERLGWSEGQGLGTDASGLQEPLMPQNIRPGRRGLGH